MVDRLGWTLVHFVWEGAAVALLLAVALRLSRRLGADVRYALALMALALAATLPFFTFAILRPAPETDFVSGNLRWTPGEIIAAGPSPIGQMPIVVAGWAFGVLLLSLRLAGSILHLERLRRRQAEPAPPAEQLRLDALAQRLGVRRKVALLFSERLQIPSAWGVLRPVVVLPASLVTHLPLEQLEGILLHELAHVRRHDYLVNLLQGVVETALFYHPAVWWISSVVRREREHLCDDVAVATLGDPMPYARALLHLEECRQAPRPALSAKEGNLMNRIARVLAPRPAPARISPLTPTLAVLGVLGLALGGVLRAEAQSNAPVPPKKTIAKKPASASAAKVAARREALRRAELARQAAASHRIALHQAEAARNLAERQRLQAELSEMQARLAAAQARAIQANAGARVAAGAPPRAAILRDLASKTAIAPPAPARLPMASAGVAMALPGSPVGMVGEVHGGPNHQVSVDVQNAPFTQVIRSIAREAKLSVVVEFGFYPDITMVLDGRPAEDALQIACQAGHATYRIEAGVYYISLKPMPAAPAAGGIGGGGFGR